MAARGFDALRADTAREYLINLYSRLLYHVVLRGTELDRGRNNQPFPLGVLLAGFGNRGCQSRVDVRQASFSSAPVRIIQAGDRRLGVKAAWSGGSFRPESL